MAKSPAQRCRAAILAAVVIDYRRLVEQDEAGTPVTLRERRKGFMMAVAEPIASARGRDLRC